MNITYKRAVITSLLFGVDFVLIFVLFFTVGLYGIKNFSYFLVSASILITITYVSYGFIVVSTNKKENVVDERDYHIMHKASTSAIILTLLYIFLFTIILFITNENEGNVNVYWLWLIAYSTFNFGYFIMSLLIVILYKKDKIDG